MQRLEVSGAVRPLKWTLGVKWLIGYGHMPQGNLTPRLTDRLLAAEGL
jgi:hypothetical protein